MIVGVAPSTAKSSVTFQVAYLPSEIGWTAWSGVIRLTSCLDGASAHATTAIVPSSNVAAGNDVRDAAAQVAEAAVNWRTVTGFAPGLSTLISSTVVLLSRTSVWSSGSQPIGCSLRARAIDTAVDALFVRLRTLIVRPIPPSAVT